MDNEQPPSLFGLNIDQESTTALRTAAQWGRALSVLGFILGGLVLLFGIVIYSKITVSYGSGRYVSSSVQSLATRYLIVCILLAGTMITGAIFTLNFSNRTIIALNTSDQFSLNSGFAAIKSAIIFWSVIFIIFIILVLLAFAAILYI
jgi:hypothetical protein